MSALPSRSGLGAAAGAAEGCGSCADTAESDAAHHLALGEGRPWARSKSLAARPGAVGVAAGSPRQAQEHGGCADRRQERVPHPAGGGDKEPGAPALRRGSWRLLRQPRLAASF